MRRGVDVANVRRLGGLAAGPLFVGISFALGATTHGYSSLRHPVSSLAIGPGGWIQSANFVVTGVLITVLAPGIDERPRAATGFRWLSLLVAASGLGLVGAGIFTSDPVFGFPLGVPPRQDQFSIRGHLHDAASMLFFSCLPAAAFVSARVEVAGQRGRWSAYSVAAGAAFIALFVLTSVAFRHSPALAGCAGLLQRATIIIGMTWLSALAVRKLSISSQRA